MANKKAKAPRITKKDIYAEHGIDYDPKTQRIYSPVFGWIKPLLINGNDKLGKGVYTFSILPGMDLYAIIANGQLLQVRGTCPCSCKGCYAQRGRYVFQNVQDANARKTILAREYLGFTKRAILAQIKADHIRLCRIHAAGDFFSVEYAAAWHEIAELAPECTFWSYTKNSAAEAAFDDLANVNIVKSCIPGIGFNFGHCDYILRVYRALQAAGKSVYICRCGVDRNQHCTNCTGCSRNEHVLFIEHSTEYQAEKDPFFAELKAVIDAQ